MKKGESNTMWVLIVAVVVIFLIISMMYMTQSESSSFSNLFSDMFQNAEAQFDDIKFGQDEPGSVGMDKKVVKWIAHKSDKACQGEYEEDNKKKYTFSPKFEGLTSFTEEKKLYVKGTWRDESGDLEVEEELETCESFELTGDTPQKDESYHITIKPQNKDKPKKGAEVHFIHLKEGRNVHPDAQIKWEWIDKKKFKINFSAKGSSDRDGEIEEYRWDLNNRGTDKNSGFEKSTKKHYIDHRFKVEGKYRVRVKVVDNQGGTDIASTQPIEIDYDDPSAIIKCDKKIGPGKYEKVDFDDPQIKIGQSIRCSGEDSNSPLGVDRFRWAVTKEGEKKKMAGPNFDNYDIDELGNYRIKLEIEDKNLEKKDTMIKEFQVDNHPPEPKFSYKIHGYDRSMRKWKISVDGSGSSDTEDNYFGKEMEYRWKDNGKLIALSKETTIFVPEENPDITLEVTDSHGADSSKTREIKEGRLFLVDIANARVRNHCDGWGESKTGFGVRAKNIYSESIETNPTIDVAWDLFNEYDNCRGSQEWSAETEISLDSGELTKWKEDPKGCNEKRSDIGGEFCDEKSNNPNGVPVQFDVNFEIESPSLPDTEERKFCVYCEDCDKSIMNCESNYCSNWGYSCSVSRGACEHEFNPYKPSAKFECHTEREGDYLPITHLQKGDTLKCEYTGKSSIDKYTWWFYREGGGRKKTNIMAKGESASGFTEEIKESGNFQVDLQVRGENKGENENSKSVLVNNKPDFVVSDISWNPREPSNYLKDYGNEIKTTEDLWVEAEVKSKTRSYTGPEIVHISFYLAREGEESFDNDEFIKIGEKEISQIETEETLSPPINYGRLSAWESYPEKPRKFKIKAVVNENDKVSELSGGSDNNARIETISIQYD